MRNRAIKTVALVLPLAATLAWGQLPTIIPSTRAKVAQAQKMEASNAPPAPPAPAAGSAAAEVSGELIIARKVHAGKRDPFLSPVVNRMSEPACTAGGKRCLEIGQVNLKGVVKAEAGMIAVVTNAANKAYFLHENDPVYNGYVVKITGDSIVFKESVQDKLGHSSTREVVKKVSAPAV